MGNVIDSAMEHYIAVCVHYGLLWHYGMLWVWRVCYDLLWEKSELADVVCDGIPRYC
jgi:hypothetical protein